MIERLQPGLLLLLWCGIAATFVARPVAPADHPSARAGAPRSRRALTLALDLILYPVLYAIVLEAIGRADILTGAALGATHATLALATGAARARTSTAERTGPARLRAFLARTLYGIVFAFLYVVPAP